MPSGINSRNQRAGSTLAERLAFYSRRNANGCLEWTGAKAAAGYGVVWVLSKQRGIYAHRAAWENAHGPIAPGLVICHKCDNPRCIEVEHLFVGTHADNVADKIAKGRQPRGEDHGKAKLTEAAVRAILDSPLSSAQLARETSGISRAHLYRIRNGKRWAHLRQAA